MGTIDQYRCDCMDEGVDHNPAVDPSCRYYIKNALNNRDEARNDEVARRAGMTRERAAELGLP